MIKSNCWSFKLPFVCWRSLPLGISLFAYISTVGRVKAIDGQTRPVKFKCTAFHLRTRHHQLFLCGFILYFLAWRWPGKAFSSLCIFQGYCSFIHTFKHFSLCAAWVRVNYPVPSYSSQTNGLRLNTYL